MFGFLFGGTEAAETRAASTQPHPAIQAQKDRQAREQHRAMMGGDAGPQGGPDAVTAMQDRHREHMRGMEGVRQGLETTGEVAQAGLALGASLVTPLPDEIGVAVAGGAYLVRHLPSAARAGRTARNCWDNIFAEMVASGGSYGRIARDNHKRAEEYYDTIRREGSDITAIAKSSGMSEERVRRIEHRLFHADHVIRYQNGEQVIKRFDAHPKIANAWQRLQEGASGPRDIDLLKHEIFESRFEAIHRTDYLDAHRAPERSGRVWDPEDGGGG